MLEFTVPEFGVLRLEHLVLDYNGTLACDGRLSGGVAPRLAKLRRDLDVHVVTADTFGVARAQLAEIPRVKLVVLDAGGQAGAKQAYVESLGAASTVCIGNGRNDRLMLRCAALGIAVVQAEGAAAGSLAAADIVATDIVAALDLLVHPLRLVATLRG